MVCDIAYTHIVQSKFNDFMAIIEKTMVASLSV